MDMISVSQSFSQPDLVKLLTMKKYTNLSSDIMLDDSVGFARGTDNSRCDQNCNANTNANRNVSVGHIQCNGTINCNCNHHGGGGSVYSNNNSLMVGDQTNEKGSLNALMNNSDGSTSILSAAAATISEHYKNKNNLAKLLWWNAPTPKLILPIKHQPYNNAKDTDNDDDDDDNDYDDDDSIIEYANKSAIVSNNLTANAAMLNSKDANELYQYQQQQQHQQQNAQKQQPSLCDNTSHKLRELSSTKNLEQSNKFDYSQQFGIEDPDQDPDYIKQDLKSLLNDKKPSQGFLNAGEDDEMKITGYRRSNGRTILCWLCIFLTSGLLRLIMHWWRHLYLKATHVICSLEEAEYLLIEDNYKGKHKTYYVEAIQRIDYESLRKEQSKQFKRQKNRKRKMIKNKESLGDMCIVDSVLDSEASYFHLSMHFSTGQFKHYKSARLLTCKQLRYAWNTNTQTFDRLCGLDHNVNNTYFYQQQTGLTAREQLARRIAYGINEITIPYKDIKTLLFLEVLNPFYVFQIFSVILWFTYDYYYYACVILLMSIFGIVMSVLQTKKNQDALREIVLNTGNVLIVNDKGDITSMPTQFLVPGDIIEIPSNGCTMQCDAVLLSGNCIVDESLLTGESVPITKTPLPMKRDVVFDKKEHARHTLFCGTKVIQTRYFNSEKVLALVINTGNITTKGGLIRSILYPPPVDYKFEQDSYKFIEFLGLIALIGFIYTLISKIMRGVDPIKIAVESLDLITIVVPPALPAAMTVGRYYAQKRLENNNIYCISPRSINVAGSIDCCCFDKTGTLTEDGLDMWGVVPKSATNQFQIPIKDIERLPYDHFLFGMVTCHSITIMNGQMMGDPLDLKMFESTGWIMEDPKDVLDTQKYGLLHPTIFRQPKKARLNDTDLNMKQILREHQSSVDDLLSDVGLLNGESNNDHGIVREFPFTSNLQRMSVITRRLSEKNFNVYCKGSPEMLQQLCVPNSLPDNYSQQLAVFAKQGYRVIAMSYKSLSSKVNYTKVQRLTREHIESGLNFLGFVVMENRLKPDTTEVIGALTKANIRTIMVTGDNILTALSVARDCGIVSSSQPVVTVTARQHNHDKTLGIMPAFDLYYTLDLGSKNCSDKIDDAYRSSNAMPNGDTNGTLSPSITNNSLPFDNSYHLLNGDVSSLTSTTLVSTTMTCNKARGSVETVTTWTHNDTEIGVDTPTEEKPPPLPPSTTDSTAWRQNYRFAMAGKTWQIVRDHFPDLLPNFLTRGVIYARMSPEQKQALIMELQNLDYSVAMCGDGANDCGALKVAHAGISLSETESSIASPFTSRIATIAAVPNVIKEGRAALVTSFGIFKYMAAYSMVQFISVMILYSIDSNLTDKQFLFVDLGLISIFAFFFGKTESFKGPLSKQVPLSSLISLAPLASIVLHLLIVVAFLVAGWFHLHQQPWFKPFEYSNEDHLGCVENYTMFAISGFQYIILAFVFSKGAPYRQPIWTNVPFCLTLIINLGIVIYLVIYPTEWLKEFMQFVIPDEMGFRYWMLAYGIINFTAHLFVENIIIEYFLFKKLQARRDRNARTSKRKYMHVEYEMQFCPNWPHITEDVDVHDIKPVVQPTTPAYFEISAEHNFDITAGGDNLLNSLFDLDVSAAAANVATQIPQNETALTYI